MALLLGFVAVLLLCIRLGTAPGRSAPPYSIIALVAAVAVAAFGLGIAVVTRRIVVDIVRDGRVSHRLPGTGYDDVDGGEEWWLLMGKVEVVVAGVAV